MIRSMISKTIRSTITTLINPFYGLLSRYFVTLDPVLNSHYEMATPVTFTGDFEIEVEFSTTSTVIQIITGDTSNDFISLISSGTKVRFKIGGVEADSNSLTLIDGKLHKIKVVRVGSVITTFVDGIASATLTNAGVSTFGYIGTWDVASLYFNGIIANAKFTDQSGASDVITTFKLDQATDITEYSQENTFGSEEIVNGDFTNGTTDWASPRNASSLSIINNKLVSAADGTAPFGAAQRLDNLVVGKSYKLIATATCSNSLANIWVRVSTSSFLGDDILSINGKVSVIVDGIFTATAARVHVGALVAGHAANDTLTFDAGVSVKEITNAVEYKNIPQSARDLYTLDGNIWTDAAGNTIEVAP